MASSSSGYVAVPRCPLTFDGTNYADFAAHMRFHMRGLQLWGVLYGEVPCPPRPLDPVAPVPPTPPVIAANAPKADRVAAKTTDDATDDDAVDAYDQQIADFSEALSTYRDAHTIYTQWCDEDVRAAAVLTASILPQFASEFMALPTASEMWDHLRQRGISPLLTLSICLLVRSGPSGACSSAG
jgi:hypothetical protein